jgi:hypothetical protein
MRRLQRDDDEPPLPASDASGGGASRTGPLRRQPVRSPCDRGALRCLGTRCAGRRGLRYLALGGGAGPCCRLRLPTRHQRRGDAPTRRDVPGRASPRGAQTAELRCNHAAFADPSDGRAAFEPTIRLDLECRFSRCAGLAQPARFRRLSARLGASPDQARAMPRSVRDCRWSRQSPSTRSSSPWQMRLTWLLLIDSTPSAPPAARPCAWTRQPC